MNYNLLEICGKGYVIEHYVSFFHKEQKELSYKVYVTNALKAIAKNTAVKEGDIFINENWLDLIKPKKQENEKAPERTEEEVIQDIKNKLLRFGKGGKA